MNRTRNRMIAILSIFFMLISIFLPSTPIATANSELQDGEYEIGFTVVKPNTDTKSTMDGYTEKPAKLNVVNGNMSVQLTFTTADMIQVFQVKQDDDYINTTVINEDTENNKRTVEFDVSDLNSRVDAKTHVIVSAFPGFPGYDSWYDVQVVFDVDSLKSLTPQQPTEPTEPEEPTEPSEPEQPINLEEGKNYNISFIAIRADNENASSMDGRFAKPASLTYLDGKYYVTLSLTEKGKEYVTGLEMEKEDGTWVRSSEDFVIENFEVANLLTMVNSRVSMEVPMKDGSVYKNTQSFRIIFDVVSIEQTTEPTEPTEPEQPTNPTEPEQPDLKDGQYELGFTVVKPNTDSKSTMDGYTEKPAKLIVENGQKRIQLTFNSADMIHAFKVLENSDYVDANIVSEDEENNIKIVEFNIRDLNTRIDAKTHVIVPANSIPGFPGYDSWYDVQIQFDTSSLPVEQPTNPTDPSDPGESVVVIDENQFKDGKYEFSEETSKPIKINTTYKGTPISIVVPAGSNSLTIKKVATDPENKTLVIDISVGGLGDQKVTLTIPKPSGLSTDRVGAFHQNGAVWEYRAAQVDGNNNVIFETNLSAVKIAEIIDMPTNVTSAIAGNKVTLNWNAVTGATYEVAKIFNGTETILKNIQDTTLTETLNYNTKYQYKVRAIKDGHQSNWTTEVTVNTDANTGGGSGSSGGSGGSGGTGGNSSKLEDGVYSIDFQVYKNGTYQQSVMADYVVRPAKLTIENGKYYVTVILKNSSWTKVFEVNGNGGSASVVNTDASSDTREIQFEVYDLSRQVEVYTEVVIPTINYDGKYDVQFQFNKGSIESNYSKPPVSSVKLEDVKLAVPNTKKEDGDYSIEYKVFKNNTEQQSVMADYVVNPAKLTVKNGKNYINLILKNSSWTKVFEVKGNGSNMKVLSQDAESDTRMVQFIVDDLTKKVEIYTEVLIPDINYDGKYNVQFLFDPNSVKAWKEPEVKKVEAKLEETEKVEQNLVKFNDIKGHWAENVIARLVNLGAIGGYPDGTFKPNQTITRAEFASLLVKSFKLEGTAKKVFVDTENHWAKDAISIAAELGIVGGFDNQRFNPDAPITREQMAAMMSKALHLKATKDSANFTDKNNISKWANQAVHAVVNHKIMAGYLDGTFRPQVNSTRAEAVSVIVKGLDHNTDSL